MASRKPDLKVPIPAREPGEFSRSTTSLRSPRFIEDFDAPFSEALVNSSRITLATTELTWPSTSTTSRTSFGEDTNRRPMTMNPDSPLRWQDASWDADSKRSSVNERVREWAKKSIAALRNKPEPRDGYFDTLRSRRKSSVVVTPSSGQITPNDPDGPSPTESSYSQAIVSIAEIQGSPKK